MQDPPSYQRILLAVPLAPECAKVARRAAQMARLHGARLTLLHVVTPVDFAITGEEMMAPQEIELDRVLLDRATSRLATLAQELEALLAAPVTALVEIGHPRQEILRVAREMAADLIVMGSHDHRGLELLLGSVSGGLLHHAPCDLLAVRAEG